VDCVSQQGLMPVHLENRERLKLLGEHANGHVVEGLLGSER
jgi:hypothetical protein